MNKKIKSVPTLQFSVLLLSLFLLTFFYSCKTSELANETNEEETVNLNEIISFSKIKLGGVNLKETIGSCLATATNQIYKSSQLANGGSAIDIVFVGIDGMRFFESPDKDLEHWGLDKIPNASNTKVTNYIEHSGNTFTVGMFDSMTDSTPLNNLTIEYDNNTFPTDTPRIVLFQNALGLKGVIKITKIVSGKNGYIEFDLKMQKHQQK